MADTTAAVTYLTAKASDRYTVLKDVSLRVDYVRYIERQKKARVEREEKEKVLFAQIDWHDFVVCETIEFTRTDEAVKLPLPTSLNELENMTIVQKEKGWGVEIEEEEEEVLEEAGPNPDRQESKAQQKPDVQAPIKIRKDYVNKVKKVEV